uniref:Uncharacterized protein n=1 Tax=Cryptococcus bacillisporus CA1280 TaxID=1296109 RepID=A0A0D0VHK9_CRYGA|nr:hypothetical protein I312_04531 [Cryptococcus bacillisporus CA1280]
MPWLETTGQMMEEDSKSGWEECYIAFRGATMLFKWVIKEFFCDWSTFDHQAIQHCCLLMGTNLYPSDKQMADLYCTAYPEILFINLMTRPGFKSGT